MSTHPYSQAFDILATLVAVVHVDGKVVFANSALEDMLGVSKRHIEGDSLSQYFLKPAGFESVLKGAQNKAFVVMRYDAHLRRPVAEPLPVHVIVAPTDKENEVLVELLPLEQQARLEREDRLIDQAQANKELIRNLAHEIKNPLGGIRGAAQLLQMEVAGRDLVEYTQVIVHEADRLQLLVDRLLAPHRRPRVVGEVNIHEVCERVRTLILAEFPRGLKVVRDYDISIPDIRGDREQLIQAVLNIVHNAAHALSEKIAVGDAQIVLKTRIFRQATFGKNRHRLALELHVVDNGPGVPEEIKDRLFFPLVSGRDGGSGLGLNLAQSFIQQHHGLIECDSEPGRTDFKIVIPLA
jgi:two-component system nitrogen regulation sensor histidine kinase GlnL